MKKRRKKKKVPVAILGTGNIGSDLLMKIMKSDALTCSLFVGQNPQSQNIARAKRLGVPTSSESINGLISAPSELAVVFDATSATAHKKHAPILKGSSHVKNCLLVRRCCHVHGIWLHQCRTTQGGQALGAGGMGV